MIRTKQPTIEDIYAFDNFISTPGVRQGLLERAGDGDPELTIEDTDDGQVVYYNAPHGEQVAVGRPIQLAMGGNAAGRNSDRPISDVPMALMDMGAGVARGAVAQTLGLGGDLEKLYSGLKSVFNRPEDQSRLDAFIKGMEQPTTLPTTERMGEILPPVVPAGAPDAQRRQGSANYGQAFGELAPLPGGIEAGTAALKAGAKALAPKAGEMIIKATEKTGMPVRGLNIIEDAPQLAVERVPGVKAGDELIVQHNLTSANLLKADKLGGLPVPSMAISKVGSPLEGFGEITLIAPKEMATPSAKNPVFASDAYTKRFPTIDYQLDRKSVTNFKNLFADTASKMPDGGYQIDLVLNEWKDREYSRLYKAKFLDDMGMLPNKADFKDNPYDFYIEVAGKVNEMKSEFKDWLANFDNSLADNGVNVKERIFKGYTYNGDRRYAQVNLKNLVSEMKGGAGEEGWNYGASSLRAVATPKFRTFSQVKAARDKIVSPEEMKAIKDQTSEAYDSLLNRLYAINPKYDASDALREVVDKRNINALDREYDAPPELKADISIFIQKLKELPTEYFELKPQRAVSLDEFRGAIIPKDTPAAARAVLKKHGITDIHEYSTDEERKSLFGKYGKEMFATMPAVPAGQGIIGDKEQK